MVVFKRPLFGGILVFDIEQSGERAGRESVFSKVGNPLSVSCEQHNPLIQ